MSKLRIGDRVQLKPSLAKWFLDHPEIYQYGNGALNASYEPETLLHLACCLGEPVIGVVMASTALGDYLIDFEVGSLRANYYVMRKNVIKIK